MKYIKKFERLKISDINIDDYVLIKKRSYNGVNLIPYAKIIKIGNVKTHSMKYKTWFKIGVFDENYKYIIISCHIEDIIRKMTQDEIEFFNIELNANKYNL